MLLTGVWLLSLLFRRTSSIYIFKLLLVHILYVKTWRSCKIIKSKNPWRDPGGFSYDTAFSDFAFLRWFLKYSLIICFNFYLNFYLVRTICSKPSFFELLISVKKIIIKLNFGNHYKHANTWISSNIEKCKKIPAAIFGIPMLQMVCMFLYNHHLLYIKCQSLKYKIL